MYIIEKSTKKQIVYIDENEINIVDERFEAVDNFGKKIVIKEEKNKGKKNDASKSEK